MQHTAFALLRAQSQEQPPSIIGGYLPVTSGGTNDRDGRAGKSNLSSNILNDNAEQAGDSGNGWAVRFLNGVAALNRSRAAAASWFASRSGGGDRKEREGED